MARLKTEALQEFRRKLRADEPVFGLWSTLPSPSITAIAVAAGLDWVAIDAEHGSFDWGTIDIRATVRSSTVLIVRVSELNSGLLLNDPWTSEPTVYPRRSSALRRTFVELWTTLCTRLRVFERLAVTGQRDGGNVLPRMSRKPTINVLILPNLETIEDVQESGSNAGSARCRHLFLQPPSFSASAGYAGQWRVRALPEALLNMKDRIRAAGKHCGIIAGSPKTYACASTRGFRAP